tara:strand:+ start:2734 stop:2838 length:105 start_codon:yes stop_codon:yes gene_type:complete
MGKAWRIFLRNVIKKEMILSVFQFDLIRAGMQTA